MERLSFLIKNLADALTGEVLFLTALSVMTLGLIISLLLTLFKRNYKKSARLWFCLLVGGITLGQGAITIIAKLQGGYVLLSLSVGVLYLIPVFFISGRQAKIKREERQLINFIDGQIAKLNQEENGTTSPLIVTPPANIQPSAKPQELAIGLPPTTKQVERLKTKPLTSSNESNLDRENAIDLPNFSHVKKVMERLQYFPLTTTDKRQVSDLQVTINMAERGDIIPDLKNKINDGLSVLLKIMSKYGV